MDNDLTDKDKKYVKKNLEKFMGELIFQNTEDHLNLDDEDLRLMKNAMNTALEQIRIENKEKYTPKRYRK